MKLIFIVGATATGKTEWALSWASQEKKAGILNADSIQIYKELDKGSAKPDFSKYPNIPFYLFNELQAPEVCTAGLFRKKALEVLNKKLDQEKIFVVGGSGFYIQALEKGMYPIQAFSIKDQKSKTNRTHQNFKESSKLKKTLDEEELSYLYEKLKAKDSETAKNISPKDRYRIVRALTIMERENKTLSQIKKEFQQEKLKWPYIKVGLFLPKEELLKKVSTRTNQMLQQGWIEEVEQLLKKGLKDWKALNSIGYKEIQLYLKGQLKKEDLRYSIITSTMKLAKKQKTWFKKDKSIQWFDAKTSPLKVYSSLFS